MKRLAVLVVALCGISFLVFASAQHQITDLRYNIRQDHSLLTFATSGRIPFTVHQNGNQIKIVFLQTEIVSKLRRARLHFQSGLIEKTYIDGVSGADVTVAITLRDGGKVTFPDSGTTGKVVMRVDVPRGEKSTAIRMAHVEEVTQPVEPTTALPHHSDSAASVAVLLVPVQIQDEGSHEQPVSSDVSTVGLLIALVLSFILTASILLLMIKKRVFSIQAVRPKVEKPLGNPQPLSLTHDLSVEKSLSSPVTLEENLEPREDAILRGAKTFESSRGELDLALRLTKAGDQHRLHHHATRLASTIAGDRIKVARRLGIGRGEVDLAVQLQRYAVSIKERKER